MANLNHFRQLISSKTVWKRILGNNLAINQEKVFMNVFIKTRVIAINLLIEIYPLAEISSIFLEKCF